MQLVSDSFKDGAVIPGEFAFGVIDPQTHVRLSDNRNPHLRWSDAPIGTKSFVVICHDVDVPSKGDDVNQEGKSVPASLPRVDFYHWTLVDIPAEISEIAAGQYSNGITARGKSGPATAAGQVGRQGLNSYTGWFAGDADMAGQYFGYDGPCPPWNDSIEHRYVFTVFACDVEHLPVTGNFTGQQVRDALKGHVLAEASITGRYTLNPEVQKRMPV